MDLQNRPSDWQTVPLSSICDFQNGYAFKNKDYQDESDNTYVVFRMGNVERGGGLKRDAKNALIDRAKCTKLQRYVLQRSDLCMCMTDMKASMNQLGHTALIDEDDKYILNQRVGRISVQNSDRIHWRYLYFYTNSPNYVAYLRSVAHSGVQVNLSTTAIKESPIVLPSMQVQRKIASILSAYDDLIENNLRRIRILEEMAQNLYREWFVKFRFPGHENARFVDGIPEGWEEKPLGQAIELAYGKGLKKDDRIDGDIPVYGSSGIVGQHNKALVTGPGIIVGRKGNVGSVHWAETDFFPIDTVFYVRTGITLFYVLYNLRYQNFINSDAAVPGLSRKQAYSLPFLIPQQVILDMFSENAKVIFAARSNLACKNEVLRNTRDLLLPRLISGELDVSELDITIPEETT